MGVQRGPVFSGSELISTLRDESSGPSTQHATVFLSEIAPTTDRS